MNKDLLQSIRQAVTVSARWEGELGKVLAPAGELEDVRVALIDSAMVNRPQSESPFPFGVEAFNIETIADPDGELVIIAVFGCLDGNDFRVLIT